MGGSVTVGVAEHRALVWDYNFHVLEKPRDKQTLSEVGENSWDVTGVFKDWHGHQCVLLKCKR